MLVVILNEIDIYKHEYTHSDNNNNSYKRESTGITVVILELIPGE